MADKVIISNDFLSVEISETGAEIQRITGNDGTEYIWSGNPDFWSGHAPILFPVCGGLKDDKYTLKGKEYTLEKHGFIKGMRFIPESAGDGFVVMLASENEDTLKHYPYKFEFRAIFRLTDNSLEVTYSVKNKSSEAMYFSAGAHEAYACPEGIEDYKIKFKETEELNSYIVSGGLLENKYVTIGKNINELNLIYDYFAVDALVFKELNSRELVLTNGKREITVNFDGFDNLLLWTKPGAGYICIEPWTGLPDIVGSSYDITEKESITSLRSGDEYELNHKMTFKIS